MLTPSSERVISTSEGLEISVTCEGRKSISFETFPFDGLIPVHESSFLTKSILHVLMNASFTRPVLAYTLILKPGFIRDEQASAYVHLKGFMKVVSKVVTCELCMAECLACEYYCFE